MRRYIDRKWRFQTRNSHQKDSIAKTTGCERNPWKCASEGQKFTI